MSQVSHQATQSPLVADLLTFLADGTASLLGKMQRHRQQAYARKLFGGLSDAALKDVGIDRWTVCPARPVMEVRTGLMARLMSTV